MRIPFPPAAWLAVLGVLLAPLRAADPVAVLNVWPGPPPGDTKTLPPEADQTKDSDKLIAGRRIIKLGNVSTPQIAVYRPSKDKDTGGHGYGLRYVAALPVTTWPKRAEEWLARRGLLQRATGTP
jgi:hypothetical protein